MNFITRFFKDSTPEDPVFNQFVHSLERSIRKSQIVIGFLIAIFVGTVVGLLFSSSPNANAWIGFTCVINIFLIGSLVTFINSFKVKDYVLDNLSKTIVYNKEALTKIKYYISVQGYITVEQLDEFISQEIKQRKIYHSDDKKGTKALLEK